LWKISLVVAERISLKQNNKVQRSLSEAMLFYFNFLLKKLQFPS